MADNPPVAAVVFDYGGVLTTPVRQSIAAWLEHDGIEPASFSRTLKAWLGRQAPEGTPIHRLETGELPVAEFERLFATELVTLSGTPVDPVGVLDRFFAGLRPEPRMYALAEELRACGVRVALLSNSWGNDYPRERLESLFDPVVISGEVGLRKPLPTVFELTLERLGLAAAQVVLVDDAEPNVAGARAAGLRAVLHTDPATTRAALVRLLPQLHRDPSATGRPGLGAAPSAVRDDMTPPQGE
ncbi:HAD family phosphatase [Streptomyces sp. M2CJ-2]|uniref:HAD family hydrolase n=1 Tax=Streptomyces sp. M2CJ-2 TaxID=2803948 RepID=UPI001925C6E6|nr:HAD family phosphatase [Streptomyces sp. M2CJ-2]MBL3667960.1 HAD family phosphatase [Streptomyces sp. M2CJ-2]